MLRRQDLPLRHQDAKIDIKIPIKCFWIIQAALSLKGYGESKNHVAETSGPTLETLGCKNWLKNLDLIILEYPCSSNPNRQRGIEKS